uniref:Major capsid protein n=1 Tax=Siphoviridae sp. ctVqj4 TaxID=2826359 RepID=A0A8S5NL37_9CAUD|nr:MAG TPA: major capsid protein [Siphoviridae sp. ctVqj4]
MAVCKELKELYEKRDKAIEQAKKATSTEELDQAELEIRKAEIEIKKFKLDHEEEFSPEVRSVENLNVTSQFNPVAIYRSASVGQVEEETDIYATMEYRKAFMDYMVKGTPIPEKFTEKRSDALTTVTDVAAVIPTTILNRVIEDMTVEGKILSRVTQTAYQGGVQIPISEISPEATWLANESVVSDEQKGKMDAKLSFTYHVLEARVAIGLLSQTVSLPIFEATVVKQLKKAMTKSLEKAIISGTGSGEPLGITKYASLPAEQVIEMNEETIGTVSAWADVEAAIPEAYEDSVIYMMSKATWEKYLNGMTDKNGQRIGLGKINEKGQKILNGREVLTVENLPSFMTASVGDIFAVVIDLTKYCLNSNLAMYYRKYFDEDKNKWVHKALLIADGKMMIGEVGEPESKKYVGAKGLIYIKKKEKPSAYRRLPK